MLAGIEENRGIAVTKEHCPQVGKECPECIFSSASVVALLCPTLDAAVAQHIFFKCIDTRDVCRWQGLS